MPEARKFIKVHEAEPGYWRWREAGPNDNHWMVTAVTQAEFDALVRMEEAYRVYREVLKALKEREVEEYT